MYHISLDRKGTSYLRNTQFGPAHEEVTPRAQAGVCEEHAYQCLPASVLMALSI